MVVEWVKWIFHNFSASPLLDRTALLCLLTAARGGCGRLSNQVLQPWSSIQSGFIWWGFISASMVTKQFLGVINLWLWIWSLWFWQIWICPREQKHMKFIWNSKSEVNRVGWWMSRYGGSSPKRQYAYANATAIRKLDVGWRRME